MIKFKEFINIERNFEIELPILLAEFRKEFLKRYISNKKSDFKGEIEVNDFKLKTERGFFSINNFSILTGKIHKKEKYLKITCKIELSEAITLNDGFRNTINSDNFRIIDC